MAARARVARTTVSRVLNNGPNVRSEVRERVRAAIDELGYRPNAQARHLASGTGRQIGLIYATDAEAEPNSYYHSGLELGAMRACAERGFTLVTHTAVPSRPADRERIIELARSGSYDGLILTPPYSDDVALAEAIRKLDCPLVCISAGPEARRHVSSVSIDDRAAGRAIGDFLVGLGHRGEQPAVHLAPQERADIRVRRPDGLVEQRSDEHVGRGIGHGRRLVVWIAAVAGGRPLRFQSASLQVERQHAADRGESSTSCALSGWNRRW